MIVNATIKHRPNVRQTGTRWSHNGHTFSYFDPDTFQWIIYFAIDKGNFRHWWELILPNAEYRFHHEDTLHRHASLPDSAVCLGKSERITL